jgi:hypothetical protein
VPAGSTSTYSYAIVGGSGYENGDWRITGGTIQSTNGNQATILWGSDTALNEARVAFFVKCGTQEREGSKNVDITTGAVCRAYSYNGGLSGGTLNYTQCSGVAATPVSVQAGEINDFCALQNAYTTTGTIAVTDNGDC